jgi:predicted nucleic acid-binding protein
MMTAVDTNILLDVLIPDAPYGATSQQSLDTALQEGTLVLNEVVYAELAAHFPTQEELERFLADTDIRLLPSQPVALARGGRAWAAYTRQRGTGFLSKGTVQAVSSDVAL